MPAKSKVIKLPKVPDEYFGDFLRGYFDGDGNVVSCYFRKKGRVKSSRVFSVRFTSGSMAILSGIQVHLMDSSCTGSLFFSGHAWRLNYGRQDSGRIYHLMYRNVVRHNLLYLERKYKIFQDALRP